MPLVTDDIFEARAAYFVLERRALTAEQNVSSLRDTIGNLNAAQQSTAQSAQTLKDFSIGQIQTNSQLVSQRSDAISPDVSLAGFIASLGLAAAIGEASMPDRVISSLNVTVQGYVAFDATQGPQLRLYQPEFGSGSVLATISFELAKVSPQPNVSPIRSLYSVLQDMQAVFGDPFWSKFVTGTPPSLPAAGIVDTIAKSFANIQNWNFPFLIQQAQALAAFETALANLVGVPAFTSAVALLASLTGSLDPAVRTSAAFYVAGDLFALSSSLDATAQSARSLLP